MVISISVENYVLVSKVLFSFAIKLKGSYRFRGGVMLFYILQKQFINYSCIYLEDLLSFLISGPKIK
jgi:hypothetical protein